MGQDFNNSQCPQDRDYDTVSILKDQESLVISHLPFCKYPEVRKLMEVMSDRSQRKVNESTFGSFLTDHAYLYILKGKGFGQFPCLASEK